MKYSNKVIVWLFIGLIMVFIQVVVGGITRLTESGLSITKWEVISGSLPPLTDSDWQYQFDLYKNTPQYLEINEGMNLEEFKFIYFWEYIHRFWARIMGFVFFIPFLYFLFKGYLDRKLLKFLALVICLALLAATFGWIMVASGLIERPWVNAYKLSIHLLIAFSVYSSLLWTFLFANRSEVISDVPLLYIKRLLWVALILLVVQIFFGGVMSGMKSAVVYPSWPDMNGGYFPSVIFDPSQWRFESFINYDKNPFMPALIHFLHRNTAYILFIIGNILSYKLYRVGNTYNILKLKKIGYIISSLLFFQLLLGIITVISSKGTIPVLWGVLHQAGALLLLSAFVFAIFTIRIKK